MVIDILVDLKITCSRILVISNGLIKVFILVNTKMERRTVKVFSKMIIYFSKVTFRMDKEMEKDVLLT